MEKNKTFKILAIVGLVVAVVGLAIGFAAFSATLNISTFNATAKAGDADAVFANLVTFQNDATCTVSEGSTATATAGTATGHTWSGITATFTKPGDVITCTATVKNASAYIAYVYEITSNDQKITCSGSAQNISSICSNVTLNTTLSTEGLTVTSANSNWHHITTSNIPAGNTDTVTTTITYAESAPIPDADVTISIPAINYIFNTVKNK